MLDMNTGTQGFFQICIVVTLTYQALGLSVDQVLILTENVCKHVKCFLEN